MIAATTDGMNLLMEHVDLAAVAEQLRSRFQCSPVTGHMGALAAFRDVVADRLGCSMTDAERIVETLVARGFLRPSHEPGAVPPERVRWIVSTSGR
jgi:hypothetical protein